MVPACVILSLGLWSWISAPGSGSRPARPSPVARKVADSCWGFKEFDAISMTGAGVLWVAKAFGATVLGF